MTVNNSPPHRLIYRLLGWLVRTFLKIVFGLKVVGLDHIPKTGAFIFASNHRSILDPPVLGSVCTREIFFAAKKELLAIPVFGRIIAYLNAVPVRRTGYDRGVLRLLGGALDNGYGIMLFPEGTRSRDGKLGKPRPGVGILSRNHISVVVPVFITGSSDILKQIYRRQLKVQFGENLRFGKADFKDELDVKDTYRKISVEVIRSIAKLGGVDSPA